MPIRVYELSLYKYEVLHSHFESIESSNNVALHVPKPSVADRHTHTRVHEQITDPKAVRVRQRSMFFTVPVTILVGLSESSMAQLTECA